MTNDFLQKVDLTGHIQNAPMEFNSMPSINLDTTDETSSNFKDVMSGLAQNINQDLNAPDQLLKSAMAGDKNVDIHDVMTAMAKAELSINVTTQITTKVIQAYDKIMQISV